MVKISKKKLVLFGALAVILIPALIIFLKIYIIGEPVDLVSAKGGWVFDDTTQVITFTGELTKPNMAVAREKVTDEKGIAGRSLTVYEVPKSIFHNSNKFEASFEVEVGMWACWRGKYERTEYFSPMYVENNLPGMKSVLSGELWATEHEYEKPE